MKNTQSIHSAESVEIGKKKNSGNTHGVTHLGMRFSRAVIAALCVASATTNPFGGGHGLTVSAEEVAPPFAETAMYAIDTLTDELLMWCRCVRCSKISL